MSGMRKAVGKRYVKKAYGGASKKARTKMAYGLGKSGQSNLGGKDYLAAANKAGGAVGRAAKKAKSASTAAKVRKASAGVTAQNAKRKAAKGANSALMGSARGAGRAVGAAKNVSRPGRTAFAVGKAGRSKAAGKRVAPRSFAKKGSGTAHAVGRAAGVVSRNKGKTALAVGGVAAVGGAAYAYKRRKNSQATYKRKLKNGKTITVRKGRRR